MIESCMLIHLIDEMTQKQNFHFFFNANYNLSKSIISSNRKISLKPSFLL